MWTARRIVSGLLLITTLACQPAESRRPMLIQVLETADRRAPTASDLDFLRTATSNDNAQIRAAAVRALGRLERAELADEIAAALGDDDPQVRGVAAWSLAQSVSGADPATAIAPLYTAMARDPVADVRAIAATSIGRLDYRDAESVADAEQALLRFSFALSSTPHAGEPDAESPRADADPAVLFGVARAFDALYRGNGDHIPAAETVTRLRALSTFGAGDPEQAPVRALSASALLRTNTVDPALLEVWMADPDTEVRRLAAGSAAAVSGATTALLLAALADPHPQVRFAALAGLRRDPDPGSRCEPAAALVADPSPHVRLLAIDLLATCPAAIATLAGLASWSKGSEWHAGAHAIVALAATSPGAAAQPLERAVEHPTWQVRMYAARAAHALELTDALRQLADDEHPNVRESAVRGLSDLVSHDADASYVAALGSTDPQLLIAAAIALENSPAGDIVVTALLSALERETELQYETSRDARHALIERIVELGSAEDADALTPYLADFDPVIAELAATTVSGWTGDSHAADPQPLAAAPFPTLPELEELADATVIVTMQDGTSFRLRLDPFAAPTNAVRFARLARDGTFAGLTLHRVAPNFVIQGGSPGANEYAGHGAYTRDELTERPHRRGTVGISTRGRDTGDGQIFVNLVDNYRLDHNYTIFATVEAGMDTVDAMLEGAAIESVRVESAPQ